MQTVMALDSCSDCGQPIFPGEPFKQTAWVDITGGRVVSSRPKSHHLSGRYPGDTTAKTLHAAG